MRETTHTLTTPDGPMECFDAIPDGDPRGGVVVIQEAFGVNDHIRDVTRRFASAGYHATAPSLFHRAGGGFAAYDDFDAITPLFVGVTDDTTLGDVDASIRHLQESGFVDPRIGIVGFCWGGRVTFLVSIHRALGAAVGFYGGGIASANPRGFPPLIGEAPALKTPWLGLFGDDDASVPVSDVETLRDALTAVSVPTDVVRYPGAGHGFHCDQRSSYHPEAAADAWVRALGWLDAHLG